MNDEQHQRHDPIWLHAGRYGRWCVCTCGWKSHNGSPIAAQLEFGQHLLRCTRAALAHSR